MLRNALFAIATLVLIATGVMSVAGCNARTDNSAAPSARVASNSTRAGVARNGANLQGVNLNDPVRPAASDQPIVLGAAQNEWASFALQISALPKSTRKTSYSFRIHAPQLDDGKTSIDISRFSVDQILPMPVDVNRAGFVRHTGLAVGNRPLPRALLPVPMDDGVVDLSVVRDPADPTNPYAHPNGANGQPLLFWVDLHVPPDARPGEYAARCDLVSSESSKPIASVPLRITIYNFVIPDERHLVMTSRLEWDDLKRLYADQFNTVTPKLMNRNDEAYGEAIKTLDEIVKLAQQHRTQVIIPRLQPTVKFPPLKAGRRDAPSVDWSDLDTVLTPWLNGTAFADKVPLGYWPLPAVDYLANYDRTSQLDYWKNAAAHFDQNEWLARSPVSLEQPGKPGRAGAADSLQLSADAAQILAVHPRLRVSLPLEDDQIAFASASNDKLLDPGTTGRVFSAAPGIVFASPLRAWPSDVKPPQRWLRTDVPGLVPYTGAGGDERDVRVWSWLAFLRQAGLVVWGSALPRTDSPVQPADPDDLVWFYPGSWFGMNGPVATIQLKWLRRAQQDFEYLWLARQRGEVLNPMVMARLIAKPVQIQPNQTPDPTYALMCATVDQSAWTDGHRLLARTILLKEPGQAADSPAQRALDIETLQWCRPQELPVLMGRNVRWQIDNLARAGAKPNANANVNDGGVPRWLHLSLGVDIYNASDAPPGQNLLEWSSVPRGWEITPNATPIPALATYHVDRFPMEARFNLAAIDDAAADHRPAEITFVNGYNKDTAKVKVVLPVAPSDRHKPGLKLDGELKDWDALDAIHTGPLVRMLNRPALQKQELQYADGPATVYTGWSDEKFFVAFNVSGVDSSPIRSTRNFVDYQFGRAWGEDLCQILVQPVFADNSLGPVLHVVCKPTGQWVERKLDPRLYVDPWQPFEGSGIRYSGRHDGEDWRGEVEIPWRAITDKVQGRPVLLRFNFSQHVHATGQTASWAGPIDFGRDDSFMGVLFLREPNNPGMAGPMP